MRDLRSIAVLLLHACLLVLIADCGKDHDLAAVDNPRDPANGGLRPPTPVDVVAAVGNREMVLSWVLSDSSHVSEVRTYRIYKREEVTDPLTLVDSSRTSPYRLRGLNNTSLVRVSVSAVLRNGLEGVRSAEMLATPGVYSITIEDGRQVTADRSVRVSLEAPQGTRAVTLSNWPDFRDSGTQSYSASVSWSLPAEDGDRTLYARFVDIAGNPSDVVSDGIRLDTKAGILAFDFEGPEERAPGDIIVFSMDAGEPSGLAQVELGSGGTVRALRDDGNSPDDEAGDGVYSLAYEAETSTQFLGVEVVGRFTDEAGNEAPPRSSPKRLTVHASPPALFLHQPESSDPEEIRLEWDRAPEGAPFGSYRLYRGESPNVAGDPARALVIEIGSRQQSSHTDTGLSSDRTYYYVVELVDAQGFATASNEVSATPRPNDPPTPVILNQPFGIDTDSVTLSWNRNQDPDFARYEVVRGEREGVMDDPSRRTLQTIQDAGTTTYTDAIEIEEGKLYHYVILVVDDFGAVGSSNEATALTDDVYPTPVNLSASDPAGETSIDLTWTESTVRDFASYKVYRSTEPGVTEVSLLLATYTGEERTRHLDQNLIENTDYYYRVYVSDKSGKASPSNERKVTTANADPPAVSLSAPVEPAGQRTPTIDLAWGASTIHDFDAYRIYRDTSPAVGEGSTLVRSIDGRTVTAFRDAGLVDNTRYYYRIFVRDDAGGSTGSDERSVVTANRPPTPVTLSASGSASNSISLSWTRNADADFQEYRLYRGFSAGSINTLIVTLTRVEQTTYTDLPGSEPGQDVFYKLVVVDRSITDASSLTSDSNIVASRLNP